MGDIHIAARDGDLEKLKRLIKGEGFFSRAVPVDELYSAPMFSTDAGIAVGDTALVCAINHNKLAIVEYLGSLGAKANANGHLEKALKFAMDNKFDDVVSSVIKNIPFNEKINSNFFNPEFILTFRKAESADAQAQFDLGEMYSEGKVIPQDEKKAVAWYQKAADQEHANAQRLLGYMYEHGLGVTKDSVQAEFWYKKAFPLLEKAAGQGKADAQRNLGWMHENGKGTPVNNSEAFKWYQKSSEQGYAKAQYNLATMYKNGTGIPKNYEQAIFWFKKAAEQGHVEAQNDLAKMYMAGDEVPQNYEQAIFWFKKAAEQGDEKALFYLGFMYENGQGVLQSNTEAVAYYQKAAAKGQIEANKRLGDCYFFGYLGVIKNYKTAFECYKEAQYHYADAQSMLGAMYYGVLFPFMSYSDLQSFSGYRNHAMALLCFERAAAKGNAQAQFFLGNMYIKGEGIPAPKINEGIAWLEKAGESGDIDAQLKLIDVYGDGKIITQDHVKKLYWLEKAAAQGNQKSKDNLITARTQAALAAPKQNTVVTTGPHTSSIDPEVLTLEAVALLPQVYRNINMMDRYKQLLEQALNQNPNFTPALIAKLAVTDNFCLRDQMEKKIKQNNSGLDVKSWLSKNKNSSGLSYLFANYLHIIGEHSNEMITSYTDAVTQGITQAKDRLGSCFNSGLGGLKKDEKQARTLYLEAAAEGCALGAYNAASCYIYGDGGPKNAPQGIKLAKQALNAGISSAHLLIGHACHYEQKSYNSALESYFFCIAALEEDFKKYGEDKDSESYGDKLRAGLSIALCYWQAPSGILNNSNQNAREWAEKIKAQTSPNYFGDVHKSAADLIKKLDIFKAEVLAEKERMKNNRVNYSYQDPSRDKDGIPFAAKEAYRFKK